MHYLGLALYAEGPTDDRFLGPILQRLCGDICARESQRPVQFNDEVLLLMHADKSRKKPRDERVLDAARQAHGAWSILFIHADADGDVYKARRERAQPALDRLRKEFDTGCTGVAVIPMQTSESWAICDGNALRQVFGTSLDDKALGLPTSSTAIERLADPKHCLRAVFDASRGSARRRSSSTVNERLSALGQQVALDRLRRLSAFQTLEAELKQALREQHVLD